MRGGAGLGEIEDVYRGRLDHFVRVATAIVGERERARDAVHEAFAEAVRKRGTFRGEGSLESWLWRFVVRAAQAEARARAVGVLDDAQERRNGHEPDDVWRVQRAIRELPERQRLILFLRYYADLDYAAIAEVTGVASGTVGAALNSAHATVRQRLEDAP